MKSHHVTIEPDYALPDEYKVQIGGRSIRTVATNRDDLAQKWITDVRRMHRRDLRRDSHLVVGLRLYYRAKQGKCDIFADGDFTSVIVLFVGSDCLIYEFAHSIRFGCSIGRIGKPLMDFLKDSKVKFVGVDVDRDVKKLQRDWPFFAVENAIELRGVVEWEMGMRMGELGQAGLEELADTLFQWNFAGAPNKLGNGAGAWYHSAWNHSFLRKDERMKRACFEAFLAFEIGSACYLWGVLLPRD